MSLNTKKPLSILEVTDAARLLRNSEICSKNRKYFGQYMTPFSIGQFMASLFKAFPEKTKFLDPGSGIGSLTASFLDEVLSNWRAKNIAVTCVEQDEEMIKVLNNTLSIIKKSSDKTNTKIDFEVLNEDYILRSIEDSKFGSFTHIIANPPYKKLGSQTDHAIKLSKSGIKASNLYAAFLALSAEQLAPGGELVAIVPRSFCNGPYFKAFRKYFFNRVSLQQVHVFKSRKDAFKTDSVLQENIILHVAKIPPSNNVLISTSLGADFEKNANGKITSPTYTQLKQPYKMVLDHSSDNFIVYLPTSLNEQSIVLRMQSFLSDLEDIKVSISTGAVVDFRHKNDLENTFDRHCAPLLYACHLRGRRSNWPMLGKKPNAIRVTETSKSYLWANEGYFVVTKRFSSKEEKKRIVATVVKSDVSHKYIGFENHLNVFHNSKTGLSEALANGLSIFLNSTMVDQYFRIFNGHTQVNATDLRMMRYPSVDVLLEVGQNVQSNELSQSDIDTIFQKAFHKESMAA